MSDHETREQRVERAQGSRGHAGRQQAGRQVASRIAVTVREGKRREHRGMGGLEHVLAGLAFVLVLASEVLASEAEVETLEPSLVALFALESGLEEWHQL